MGIRVCAFYTTLTNRLGHNISWCKVYTDVGGIKVITCLSTYMYMYDNPLAKAHGLSPRTGGQRMV